MRSSNYPGFIVLLLCLVAVGCDSSTAKKVSPTQLPDADSGEVAAGAKSSISEEDALAFSKAWVEAIDSGDDTKANELIAWREILTRTFDSFDVSPRDKKGMMSGALGATSKFSEAIHKSVEGGGNYQMVRAYPRGGEMFALFRLVDPESAFNYHLLRLRRVRGQTRADQFFVALTGQEMADTFRDLIAPGVSSQSLVGRMSGAQKKADDEMEQQLGMKRAIDAGQKKKALRIYSSMSEELRKKKVPMLYKIQATPVEDEEAYGKAVEEYIAAFPGDSAVGIMTLEAGVLREDPEMLVQGYEALAKWTGGDPYLDLMVAANLVSMDRMDKALEMSGPVDPSSMGFADPHRFKLSIALEVNDHKESLKQLRVLRDEFGFQFDDLRTAEGFEPFVKSPQFQEWEAEQGSAR